MRIGAKVIDVLIILVIQLIIGVIAVALLGAGSAFTLGELSGSTGASLGVSVIATLVVTAVSIGIDFLYNVVMVARFGGQPGKLMLGLRIVTLDGQQPDNKVAFMRWAPILALLVVGAIPIIGGFATLARIVLMIANLVMILTDDRRRDVFDHVAGTLVVTK
jgi:uncharacterized RDD family membrane protein YckC